MKQDVTPTTRWLATTADFMPALDGHAGVAERLLLLVHYGIDWSGGWVSRYRSTYWESLLPDRVICATYRSANLRRGWRDVADDLGSQPRTANEPTGSASLRHPVRPGCRPRGHHPDRRGGVRPMRSTHPEVHGVSGIRGDLVTPEPTPTSRWLAAAAATMPPLEGSAGVAERLLLLVHYGVDWQGGWVGRYRTTYWDTLLPDRVICATYRAPNLRRWWRDVADELGSQPRSVAEREELEALLRTDPLPVLEVLRFETEALLLRVRIVTEAVRAARGTSQTVPA